MQSLTLPSLLVIAGPTGAGKSRLGLEAARRFNGEIINFDSVQIYRGFDIGSAKPTGEDRRVVRHHLIDVANPADEFTAADFARLAAAACAEVSARGKLPILVGGTYFYLRALLAGLPPMPPRNETVRTRLRRIMRSSRGLARAHRWLARVDPATAARIAPADRHRLERALEVWIVSGRPISSSIAPDASTPERYSTLKFALRFDRPTLVRRIELRVDRMFADGLVDETRTLLSQYPADARPFDAIGYREAAAVVRGERSIEWAVEETKRRTRGYAKRQMTWLRSDHAIRWLDGTMDSSLHLEAIGSVLDNPDRPERK